MSFANAQVRDQMLAGTAADDPLRQVGHTVVDDPNSLIPMPGQTGERRRPDVEVQMMSSWTRSSPNSDGKFLFRIKIQFMKYCRTKQGLILRSRI